MDITPRKARDVFLAAIKLSADERDEYLRKACEGHQELHQRVSALLQAQAEIGSYYETPAHTVDQPNTESPGAVIGPYKLIEQIGEGGMGAVWMAQQTEPVKRLVALKLIKAGMDSRQVIARFEAERQALALMDHANIARVLDAGTTSAGPPYFVMDLVKGMPITRYCDEHHLTPRQRLELFIPVCQAVQHAHQKGIIHRDLKPSNVLVALYDGKAVPKVIDFGVAKAVGQSLTDKTLVTGLGSIVGTLEYMSPEQAEINQLDIDTRSDIYSLGVLLYELLTGTPPFTRRELEKAGMLEMLRVIREQEPSKPSAKLSTAEGLPTLAANRGTEPTKLTKLVRGELDWIVMKALEKDRNHRYESANGFAVDVQRYLADEPVQACPPSAWYRLCKFARRNKAALAVICVIAGALVTAVVSLAVSNWLVAREKDQKTQALSDKEKALARESAALGKAKAQELLARRRLNASQMNLGMQAWRAGEVPRVLELLEGQRPKADEVDLRGFEWFYLWRLCNGGRRVPIQGHTTAAMSLAFSPDSRTLASASWDRTLRLWDTATGKEQKVLRGHDRGVWEVAYSLDGKTLASSGQEAGSMILWDVGTGRPLHTIAGSVMGLRFTQNGKTVVGGLVNGNAIDFKEWDVASGAERATIADAGIVVGLLPDGKTLATASGPHKPNGEIRFWDLKTGSRKRTIPTYWDAATLSPDGTRVATSSSHAGVVFWDAATGMQLAQILTPSLVRGLAFSPDSKFLAGGSEDRTVTVWEVETCRRIAQDVHLDPVWAVAFSPDGKTLASGTLGGAIKLWDMTPAEEATTIADVDATIGGRLGLGRCVRFSPDGRMLLVGNKGLTKLIDVAAGKEIAVLPVSSVMAISADASVLAGRANRDEYDLWDIRAGSKLTSISLPSHNTEWSPFTLSPDGKSLAGYRAWRADHTVTLWDVTTQKSKTLKIAPPESNKLSVLCAEFSPDGKLLAAGFQFQWVTVWDVATGEVKLQFCQKPAMMNVMSVAFSPDGKKLAVGTDVGAVTLWDVDTGKLLVAFRGHTSWVLALAFSPDGHTLATAGSDKTVRLWDVITGQERSSLTGHTGGVHSVSFSPDGYTLVTASVDGTVKLWRGATDPEALAPRSDTFRARNAGSLTLPPGAIELTEAGLSRAIELDPADPAAGPVAREYAAAGSRHLAEGRGPLADSAFRRAIELRSDDREMLRQIAHAYLSRGQTEEAAAVYDQAIAWNAGDATLKARRDQIGPSANAVWNFDDGPEGWGSPHECTVSASDGILHIHTTGADPRVIVPVAAPAGWKELTLHVRTDRECQAQLFWATERTADFAEERSARFTVKPGREWAQVKVRIHPDSALTALRLDPLPEGEVRWELDAATLLVLPDPGRAYALFEQGRSLLLEQKKYAEAETALREAIRLEPALLEPDRLEAHEMLGWTLQSQGNFPEMEAAFRDVLRLKPDHAGGHHGLGWALVGQKKWREAIAPLREAVRLGWKDDGVYNALGWALLEQGEPAEAEAAFREVVRLKPDLADGHFGLGRALVDQRKFADAEKALRETLRIAPTHPWATELLDRALVGQGESAESEESKKSEPKPSQKQETPE